MDSRRLLRVFRILGRRALVTFGVVTFLVAAVLATVNITSRYALKIYVDDQLRRTPWDLAVYQRGAPGDSLNTLPDHISSVDGITQVESLAFLRARFPENGQVTSNVDGKPFTTPWLCLMAASDLSILPPQATFALTGQGDRGVDAREGAVLALIGPERAMGSAFRSLQGARDFKINVRVQKDERLLFTTPIRSVIRLERDELNRWLMDQTGSVSYIPYIGVVLLMPYNPTVLKRFDSVAAGLVPAELLQPTDTDFGHVQKAEYEPEMAYLARTDRNRLISGWDISGSLARIHEVNDQVHRAARAAVQEARSGPDHRVLRAHDPSTEGGDGEGAMMPEDAFFVDSTTEVLLERMEWMARLIGVLTLLVALPLLWMAWVLAANLSSLLMLNERRTLGLMRLRGIPGHLLGRSFVVAVLVGGLAGGLFGLLAGYVVPLLFYERGRLPMAVLLQGNQLALSAAFLIVTIALALLVSRRVVQYATTISPLEASGRIATSEATQAHIRFGLLQGMALAVGTYVLARWIFEFSLAPDGTAWIRTANQLLDFVGVPFFIYGLATLIASHGAWIKRLMTPLMRPIGGVLGTFAVRHISVKPHRTAAFLLIVALMASVSLYPTITGPSFADRAERGARVQLGTQWQLILNAPDLADVTQLRGGFAAQMEALRPQIDSVRMRLGQVQGITSVTYLIEGVLPNFYLPEYGLRGVPIYFLGDAASYLREVYAEPEVGITAPFADVIARLASHEIGSSPPVAEFWRLTPGAPILLGLDRQRRTVTQPSAGVVAHLPGLPPRSVTDRQGYVQARVDYLNHLFSSNAYVVASADNPGIADLQVLIPRVIMLVSSAGGRPSGMATDGMREQLVAALPFLPLEMHNLDDEIGKLGTDMYISLALANMRIYLIGGFFLALIAILAISLANFAEDRRTLGLLRIRGASRAQVRRFLSAVLLSPALLGLIVGGLVAMLAGFGLANYVWDLREIQTVVQLLPTRLVASPLTAAVAVSLLVSLFVVAFGFSWWEFRRSAREQILEA